MAARISHSIATLNVVFGVDQRRTTAIFAREYSERFAPDYDIAQITIDQVGNDQFMWRAFQGSWRVSEERVIRFEQVHGNALELGVSVVGRTEDARELLLEVWAALGRLTEEPERNVDDHEAGREYQTLTIIDADQPYWELFPQIGTVEDALRDRLGNDERLATSPKHMKVDIPVHLEVGGLVKIRHLRIETRFTAGDGKCFHVSSPLPSDDHRAMLETLFGDVRES